MKNQIEKLEILIGELKSRYECEEKSKYEASPHKHFHKGDIVSNGEDVGIVEWTENGTNTPYEAGYMGVGRISGRMGFMAYQRRDDWEIVDDPYYLTKHTLTIELTGVEIERLKYDLAGRNFNPSTPKDKMFDAIDAIVVEFNRMQK